MARNNINKDHEDDKLNDTQCGLGPCKKLKCLQVFANKKMFVLIYGLLGFVYSASYAYSTATLSTLEKRFKMPSRMTGIISVGNDFSSIFASLVLSYYAGKGHRPRWLAMAIYSVAAYCFLKLMPHLLWGAGEDALALTEEFGGPPDEHVTEEILLTQKRKTLCRSGFNDSLAGQECQQLLLQGGNAPLDTGIVPVIILFFANFVSGIGGSLYYTLGVSYMDDNIKKSKTPFLISVSYFLRTLGPAFGYAMGSFFLKMYIAPSLTPTIKNSDPRWIGAWWAGWWILGTLLFLLGSIIGLFPRTLPRTMQRKREALQKSVAEEQPLNPQDEEPAHGKASLKDLKETIMRLLTNKIYMCNTLASLFYIFGYMPFWVFMPKYLEFQYRISSADASYYTGYAGLVCSALGILVAGGLITWLKPRARYLAGWNVVVSIISVLCMLGYAFLGCEQSDIQSAQMKLDVEMECNVGCSCDFVKYSPVCSEDGRTTFISACHAGCKDHVMENGKKVFVDCSCVPSILSAALQTGATLNSSTWSDPGNTTFYQTSTLPTLVARGRAFPGPCATDCSRMFLMFLICMCVLKFVGSAGRASNFLVSVRCVQERDKPTSMGFGTVIFNIFCFIPSPIIFGHLIDSTCVVWGRTCTGKGNCWQYDGEAMRVLLNFSAAAFVAVGTVFDVGVWYYVKNLKIFDDDKGDSDDKSAEFSKVRELVEIHAVPRVNHVGAGEAAREIPEDMEQEEKVGEEGSTAEHLMAVAMSDAEVVH